MTSHVHPYGVTPRTGPVLIAGASRSGKTLVRWMLASHPRFAVSRRTELWPRFHRRFGDLAVPRNLDRCLDTLLARPQVAALAPDVDRLRRDLLAGPVTYPRLFGLLHEQYAEQQGAARWGDQSAGIERYADVALAAWPDATLVHLVRDPRDRYAALVQQAGDTHLPVLRTTAAWIRSAARARHNQHRHPGAYVVLRYEDLVTDPVGTAAMLCRVLGEERHPDMPRLAAGARYAEQRAHDPRGIPIHGDEVGRHRRELGHRDVAVITTTADPWLAALGYPSTMPAVAGPKRS